MASVGRFGLSEQISSDLVRTTSIELTLWATGGSVEYGRLVSFYIRGVNLGGAASNPSNTGSKRLSK
jgi:GTPase SAR1 family protein